MKKRYLSLIGLASILALTGCDKLQGFKVNTNENGFDGTPAYAAEYFSLKGLNYRCDVGGTVQLNVESLPTQFALSEATFTVKNPSIASVDNNGLVKGLAEGYTDIDIVSKDGSQKAVARVFVNSEIKTTAQIEALVDKIDGYYANENRTLPNKFTQYEYLYQEYATEGEVWTSDIESAVMVFNAETGYFKYEYHDVELKTANGDLQVSSGKFIFYTMNGGMSTRLIKMSDSAKNYIDINTSAYDDLSQIIYDVLNTYFLSGQDIATDGIDNFDGKESWDYYKDMATSTQMGPIYGCEDQMFYNMHFDQNTDVDAEDELDYYYIPAGTKTTDHYDITYMYDKDRSVSMNIDASMKWVENNKNNSRKFTKELVYTSTVEEERYNAKDKNSGFTLVDSIYSL